MKRYITHALLSLAVLSTVTGCGGDTPKTPGETNTTETNNTAPNAAADTLQTLRAAAASVIDVLANDTDVDGDTLTITAVSTPDHGGTAVIADNKIRYTPPTDYSGTETFTYTVSDGHAASATALAAAGTDTATVTVTVAKAWDSASNLSGNLAQNSELPQIAVNSAGAACAVWRYTDASFNDTIYARHFSVADKWGDRKSVDVALTSANAPQVALNRDGNAMAVFERSDGTQDDATAKRYTPAGGWAAGTLLENDTHASSDVQIAVDDDGNAIAVWEQSDGTRDNIWARRYNADTGTWGAATSLESSNTNAIHPHIAMDPNGNAMAVWEQADSGFSSVFARYYNATTDTWDAAPSLVEHNGGVALSPRVVMDANGNAIAIWSQRDNAYYNIWINRFDGNAWGTPKKIETEDKGDAINPRIAMNRNGTAVAVWSQDDGTADNIWANHYSPGEDWGTTQKIEADTAHAELPQVAINAEGNAVAVWSQVHSGQMHIFANHFVQNDGWGNAVQIESYGTGSARYPEVGMDNSGNAIVVWEQTDSTHKFIGTNRYY